MSGQTRSRLRATTLAGRSVLASTAAVVAVLALACSGPSGASSDGDDAPANGSGVTPFVQVVDGLPASPTQPASGPGATPGPDQAYVPEDSVDTTDKRVNVTVDNKTVYIRNGGQVVLGDGMAVEIFVDPYPPSTLRSWVDLYLTRDGDPVEDVSMGIEYDMLSMVHGPFSAVAENLGGGHYLLTLDYIMFGVWDQTITIRIGLDRIRFPLVLVAYP